MWTSSNLRPPFAVIAGRAGCHHICPNVAAAHVFGKDMVDGQVADVAPTILASIIIAAEYFPPGQLDMEPRPVDHLVQAYDRWPWDGFFDSLDVPAAVHDQIGLSGKNEANGPTGITHVDWFKIGVKNQHRFAHSCTRWRVLYSRPIRRRKGWKYEGFDHRRDGNDRKSPGGISF